MKKIGPRVKGDRISVISEKVRLPLTEDEIKRKAGKILSLLKESNTKVSLAFVNDERMRKLNWKFRGVNQATDCLAFSMREGKGPRLNQQLLGDVVISVDAAKRNARAFSSNIKDEITLYIIHGILHLLGFRDSTVGERKKMKDMEEGILRRL